MHINNNKSVTCILQNSIYESIIIIPQDSHSRITEDLGLSPYISVALFSGFTILLGFLLGLVCFSYSALYFQYCLFNPLNTILSTHDCLTFNLTQLMVYMFDTLVDVIVPSAYTKVRHYLNSHYENKLSKLETISSVSVISFRLLY